MAVFRLPQLVLYLLFVLVLFVVLRPAFLAASFSIFFFVQALAPVQGLSLTGFLVAFFSIYHSVRVVGFPVGEFSAAPFPTRSWFLHIEFLPERVLGRSGLEGADGGQLWGLDIMSLLSCFVRPF